MKPNPRRKQTADISGTHLWLVLMKAHRTLERLATRSIESSEVGLSDFAIMEMLLHKGPQPVNEIGRRVELTSGAITTAVDRLESRGLVTREAHSSDFEITALSTSRRESADAASKVFGVPLAFDNHRDLVNRPEVDVVAVTVKVPYHLELATAALRAGKAVYCEWPLGNGLTEAETLAALAKKKRVLAVVGLQARSAPSVAYVHDLIKQGYVGEVLSTTLIGSGMGWGATGEPYNVYPNEKRNGATMLSIALGHAADALCHCLGEVRELSATMTIRRKSFTITGTGEKSRMNADDQVLVSGLLEGGAALSIHYRGAVCRGTNLLWEINGTEGDLQLTAAGGQPQIFEMTVRGGKGGQSSPRVLPVPKK